MEMKFRKKKYIYIIIIIIGKGLNSHSLYSTQDLVLHIQGGFIYLMKVSLLCQLVSAKDEQKVKSFLKSCGENVLENRGPHP